MKPKVTTGLLLLAAGVCAFAADRVTATELPSLPRAAGVASLNAVFFVGGSEIPYNYDGAGYNGEPSGPGGEIR